MVVLDIKCHSLSRFEARSVRQAGQQLTAQGVVTDFVAGDKHDYSELQIRSLQDVAA